MWMDWYRTYDKLYIIQKRYGFIPQVVFPVSIDDYLGPTYLPSFKINYKRFRSMLGKYCLHLKNICDTEAHEWRMNQIQKYNDIRDQNFRTNLSSFLHSAMDRQSRRIILDRLLIPLENGDFNFTTDPIQIKIAANKHFQNIVG